MILARCLLAVQASYERAFPAELFRGKSGRYLPELLEALCTGLCEAAKRADGRPIRAGEVVSPGVPGAWQELGKRSLKRDRTHAAGRRPTGGHRRLVEDSRSLVKVTAMAARRSQTHS